MTVTMTKITRIQLTGTNLALILLLPTLCLGLLSACGSESSSGPGESDGIPAFPLADTGSPEDVGPNGDGGLAEDTAPTHTNACLTNQDCLSQAPPGPCLEPACNAATGACIFAAAMTGTPCDDGDGCSKNTICSNGACVGGQPVDCVDADPCTVDSCSGDGSCHHVLDPFCCTPECEGKVCGPNGCGATCGECPPSTACGDSGLCEVSCTADCGGKSCGSDGCGGSCGTCPVGTNCNATGACTDEGCTPQCVGVNCGSDGCGGSCGTCAPSMSCQGGMCQPGACVPDCAGIQCGDDGCGGACGTCAGGELCNALGQCDGACTSDCAGKQCGHDGCGGSCGTCPAGSCQEYLCVMGCIASCGTAVCGDDGCGGSCGGCAPGQTCDVAGQCSAGCVPDCAGRQCGSDGCGGSCGLCGVGTYCSPLGSCLVPDNDEVVPTGPTSGCPEDTYWHSLAQECTADDGSHIPVNREPEVTTGCGGSPAPASSWLGLLCLLLVLRPRRQTIP
jgi:hypothetical protein